LIIDPSYLALSRRSPCINAGKPDTLGLYIPKTDLRNYPRILDQIIDIGAYEFVRDQVEILAQPIGGRLCPGNELSLVTIAIGDILGYQWQKDGVNLPNEKNSTLHFASVDTSNTGKYYCNILTTHSFFSSDTAEVRVYPLPSLSLGPDTTIHTNDAITLDAGGGFENYLWNTGTEDQTLPVTSSQAGEFKYWVHVTDTNGCAASDTIRITVEQPTNLTGISSAGQVKIYPNPTSGMVNLVFSADIPDEVMITVTDLAGKVLLKQKYNSIDKGLIYQVLIMGCI
jgi:hypothetical protein